MEVFSMGNYGLNATPESVVPGAQYQLPAGGNDGSWLQSVIQNGGAWLAGGADIVSAIKGNTPTTNVFQPAGSGAKDYTMIIIIAVVILILAFMIMYIFRKGK